MQTRKLVKGPDIRDIRIALAQLVLGEDLLFLSFSVNEGTDERPEPVDQSFRIIGFRDHGSLSDGSICLFLPLSGEGAPENETRIYFYPSAPEGYVGFIEIDDGE